MAYDPFLSEIALFSFNFPPKGWALCNGQLLPINQNQALFSLLGTTYGGNGQTTFALPDLRGRVPVSVSATHALGEKAGDETITLTQDQLPQHSHMLNATALTATARARNAAANLATPVGSTPAIVNGGSAGFSDAAPDANMQASSVAFSGAVTAANAGAGQPHDNRQPYLVLSYCIALQGIFPSRN
jgi:microcystin-dependent protein